MPFISINASNSIFCALFHLQFIILYEKFVLNLIALGHVIACILIPSLIVRNPNTLSPEIG